MTYTCNPQWTKFSWFHWGLLYYKSKLRQMPLRNQTSLDAKVPDYAEEWKSEMVLRWTIPQIGCKTSGGCPFCTDRSGAETLKLQRYRKHKEEWLIWLLFQSFARRQSEDALSLLISIWARPRTMHLFIGRFWGCIEESNLCYTRWCMIKEWEWQYIVSED